ncbi:excalibur calcium-binding domain-containing protein [Streptomyces sp. NPDC087917]|uniref:excalibur calcium-binding domain-containing protein n=1 Tax=Streptomyces sp. NPDC087917 TaxID=3155060 RepID=UPI00341495A4
MSRLWELGQRWERLIPELHRGACRTRGSDPAGRPRVRIPYPDRDGDGIACE